MRIHRYVLLKSRIQEPEKNPVDPVNPVKMVLIFDFIPEEDKL